MKQTYGMVQNKMVQSGTRRYQEDRKQLTKIKRTRFWQERRTGNFLSVISYVKENYARRRRNGTCIKIWIHHKNNSCSYWILTDRQHLDQKNKTLQG
jgi:hypothetical protein